jgi:hypothetical protein
VVFKKIALKVKRYSNFLHEKKRNAEISRFLRISGFPENVLYHIEYSFFPITRYLCRIPLDIVAEEFMLNSTLLLPKKLRATHQQSSCR